MNLRHGLPPTIPRIAKLPLNDGGYPIPFFVAYINGKPDFRIIDPSSLRACIKRHLCWICGEPLGAYKAFVAGPMCGVNRTSSEPPSHTDCACWAARACPFLTMPKMVRREDEDTRERESNVSGVMIKRNPGATMVWTTKSYTLFSDGKGGALFEMGEPTSVVWFREGRAATRAEVLESISTGIPLLEKLAHSEADHEELRAMRARLENNYLPA